MNIEIFSIEYDKKHVLQNLMEKYDHDMSEWSRADVNDAGLYGYRYLDHYWTDDHRFPYFVTADGSYAGFALVRFDREQSRWEIAEFFVLRKYRKAGIGSRLMAYVFAQHCGDWMISTHVNNPNTRGMVRKAIRAVATGDITEQIVEDNVEWTFANQ